MRCDTLMTDGGRVSTFEKTRRVLRFLLRSRSFAGLCSDQYVQRLHVRRDMAGFEQFLGNQQAATFRQLDDVIVV